MSAGLLWLGHLGAAILSRGVRGWLNGSAALVALVLVVVVAEAVLNTPYAPSTVEWSPFSAGMWYRWALFWVVAAVGVPALVTLKPSGRFAYLARGGAVSALALASFFIPPGWMPHYRASGGMLSMIVVVLVLSAVGAADSLAIQAADRGRSGLVATVSTPFVVLGGLVVLAAAFWRVTLGEGVDMFGTELEPNNAPAIATATVVLVAAVLVSILIARRFRPSHSR